MYNYVKLSRCGSPMAEILNRADKKDIRLVVYHLSENHVECATDPSFANLNLNEILDEIKRDANNNHAILAIDIRHDEVYLIEDVPELNAASAVLLCVVTELLNGCVMPREAKDIVCKSHRMPTQRRASNGRFMKANDFVDDLDDEEPFGNVSDEMTSTYTPHRFHLGRH